MAFSLYNYDPSMAAAIVFVCLFGVSTSCHIFQLVRKKTWYFIPFVIGGIFETVGYVGRAMSAQETPNWTIKSYIIQSLLILLGPTLMAASIYMILGRIIRLTNGEAHSVVRVNWVTKIFVLGDVLSFLAQSGGGGMLAQANTESAVETGERVITIGLLIQIAFFGFFIVVAALFHYRVSLYPTARSKSVQVPWQKFLIILYIASAMIMVRSIYRLLEYIQGSDGVLQSKEIYLYILDSTLMFLTVLLLNVFHPSQIISKDLSYADTYAIGSEDTESVMQTRRNRGGYENVNMV